MKKFIWLLVTLSVFSFVFTGCSVKYGFRYEWNSEKKVMIRTPHGDDPFEWGTKHTETTYEYKSGPEGGHEYYKKDTHIEYDSDEDVKRIEGGGKITWPKDK